MKSTIPETICEPCPAAAPVEYATLPDALCPCPEEPKQVRLGPKVRYFAQQKDCLPGVLQSLFNQTSCNGIQFKC